MFNPNIKSYTIFKDKKLKEFRESFPIFHRTTEIKEFKRYQPEISASSNLYLDNPLENAHKFKLANDHKKYYENLEKNVDKNKKKILILDEENQKNYKFNY